MRLGLSRSFWFMLAAILLVTAGAIVGPRIYPTALLGSGYMAQTLCAGIFVSGRSFDDMRAQDLSGPRFDLLRYFQARVEDDAKAVTASAYGLG